MRAVSFYRPETGEIVQYSTVFEEGDDARLAGVLGLSVIDGRLPDGEMGYVADGQIVQIDPPPSPEHTFDWATRTWVDARTLADFAAIKWAQIKSERDRRESAGFPHLGHTFDSDPLSVQRITAAAIAAQGAIATGQPLEIDWTCADNSVITLTAEQIVGMPAALAAYAACLHATARSLRDQINAAETVADVTAIHWPTTPEA